MLCVCSSQSPALVIPWVIQLGYITHVDFPAKVLLKWAIYLLIGTHSLTRQIDFTLVTPIGIGFFKFIIDAQMIKNWPYARDLPRPSWEFLKKQQPHLQYVRRTQTEGWWGYSSWGKANESWRWLTTKHKKYKDFVSTYDFLLNFLLVRQTTLLIFKCWTSFWNFTWWNWSEFGVLVSMITGIGM